MAGVAQPAGLARRLAASAYEALLLAALLLLVGFALLPIVTPTDRVTVSDLRDAGTARPVPYLMSRAARAASGALLFGVCGAYCVGLWSGGRRTLPMKTWRIALRSAGGAAVPPQTAMLRYFAWWIGPAIALAGYFALAPLGHGRWALALVAVNYAWAVVDRDSQYLQDRIAGTRLFAVPPES
ncbi:MAG TPA: RDD family protein [Casimicrobiaceae bacterium]|nr:RDD family protein [Casimicrobiaceae bacterium]